MTILTKLRRFFPLYQLVLMAIMDYTYILNLVKCKTCHTETATPASKVQHLSGFKYIASTTLEGILEIPPVIDCIKTKATDQWIRLWSLDSPLIRDLIHRNRNRQRTNCYGCALFGGTK
jgi:hypothetical protein